MHKLFFGNASTYFDETAFNNNLSKVGEYRRKKIDALKIQEDKARCLTAGLLFAEACHAYGLDTLVDRVADDDNGKPYFNCPDEAFPGGKRMYFNISHSQDYVLVGMCDTPIGVDIQFMKEMKSDIASRCFTKEEQDYFYRASDAEYLEVFYKIWCLKESYVKFKGTGLKEGLNTFSVMNHFQDCGKWHDDYIYAVTIQDYREMDAALEAEKQEKLQSAAAELKKTLKDAIKEVKDTVKTAVTESAKVVKETISEAVKDTKDIVSDTARELEKLEEVPASKEPVKLQPLEIVTKVPEKTTHIYEIHEKHFNTQERRDRYAAAETKKSFRYKTKGVLIK